MKDLKQRIKKSKRLLISTGIAIFLSLSIFGLSSTPIFETFELKIFDLKARLSKKTAPSSEIVLITIDNETLNSFGFPVPRDVLALLLEVLRKAGAKVVGFDIIFTDPDKSNPSNDKLFSRISKASDNVCFAFGFDLSGKEEEKNIDQRFGYPLSDSMDNNLYIAKNATLPLPILLDSAKSIGHVNIVPDVDGTIRKVPLFIKYQDRAYPYLGLQLVCDYLGVSKEDIKLKKGYVALGDIVVPINKKGEMLVNFTKTGFKRYSLLQLLNFAEKQRDLPEKLRSKFKDKIVLVGIMASGAMDVGPTPISPIYPLLKVQASLCSNILEKDFIHQIPRMINLAILLVLGIMCGLISSFKGPARSLAGFLGLFGGYSAISFGLFTLAGICIELFSPMVVIILTFMSVTFYNYLTNQKEKIAYLEEKIRLERELHKKEQLYLGEKIRLERELHKKEQLDDMLKAASFFVHDHIKNPLTGIKFAAENLETAETKKESAELINEILTSIEKLKDMSKKLEDFAKPQQLKPAPVNINKFLNNIVSKTEKTMIKDGKIRITKKISPNLPLIELDKEEMEKAIENLLLNSIQAMPDGGDIEIAVQLTCNDINKQEIEIRIKDTGKGIPKSCQDKVFDFCFTLKNGGSGLGLPSVKKTVLGHFGSIDFESEEGVGTTFIIKLPVGGDSHE